MEDPTIEKSVDPYKVAIISSAECSSHTGGRFDFPARIENTLDAIMRECPSNFRFFESNEAISEENIRRFHTADHFDALIAACDFSCRTGHTIDLSHDCQAGPKTLNAVMKGAQCSIFAVDRVIRGDDRSSFCIIRPPGHHAKPNGFGGFCFLNNAGIAAKYALQQVGISRVAVLDFDVHHGDGTEEGFRDDENMFYGSTHVNVYPWTGQEDEGTRIVNRYIENRESFHIKWKEIIDKMISFEPDFLIFSAGFDAHVDDIMHLCDLTDDDFGWATQVAVEACTRINPNNPPKYISVLEGGYSLESLASGAVAHAKALAGAADFTHVGDEAETLARIVDFHHTHLEANNGTVSDSTKPSTSIVRGERERGGVHVEAGNGGNDVRASSAIAPSRSVPVPKAQSPLNLYFSSQQVVPYLLVTSVSRDQVLPIRWGENCRIIDAATAGSLQPLTRDWLMSNCDVCTVGLTLALISIAQEDLAVLSPAPQQPACSFEGVLKFLTSASVSDGVKYNWPKYVTNKFQQRSYGHSWRAQVLREYRNLVPTSKKNSIEGYFLVYRAAFLKLRPDMRTHLPGHKPA